MTSEQLLSRTIEYLFNPLYQLAVVVATLYFLYGVFNFIKNMRDPDQGNNQARIDGKNHMLWGTVGLFIILSVGGVISFLNDAVGGMFQY